MRIYRLDIIPKGINESYRCNPKGYKFLDSAAKKYKEDLKVLYAKRDEELGGKLSYTYFTMILELFIPRANAMFSGGALRRIDATNFIKLIEDAYAEYVGIDDSKNIGVAAKKFISPDDKWHIHWIVMPSDGIIEGNHLIKLKTSDQPLEGGGQSG